MRPPSRCKIGLNMAEHSNIDGRKLLATHLTSKIELPLPYDFTIWINLVFTTVAARVKHLLLA